MTVHAAVWLDQEYAQLFFFAQEGFDEADFRVAKHHVPSHGRAREAHHRGDSREQKDYFEAIAKLLADTQEVLLVGPGTAKTQFLKHLHAHEPKLEHRVVGVETMDHPTAPQIVAYARQYFRAKDQLLGTSPV